MSYHISMMIEIPLTNPYPMVANAMKIDEAASRLEALGNPTRLRIYRTLVKAGDPGYPWASCKAAWRCRLDPIPPSQDLAHRRADHAGA